MALKTYTFGSPKGLNTIQNDLNMKDDYAPVFRNAIIDETGADAKRPGFTKAGSAISGGPKIESVFEYRKKDGTSMKIAAAGGQLWKQNADGTWTSIKTGLGSNKCSAAVFQDKIVFFNGVNLPFYYDGSSCTDLANLCTDWVYGDTPSIVFAYKGRLFAGGRPSDKTMVYYCALEDINDWVSANNAGYIDLSTQLPQGRELTDIKSWETYLAFMLNEETVIWNWTSPSSNSLEKIVPVGAPWGKSVSFANDLIFVSRLGIKTLSRSLQSGELNVGSLSEMVENLIQDLMLNSPPVATAVYPYRRWVLFFFPPVLMAYDYTPQRKAWYKFDGIDAQSMLTIGNDLYFGASNGQLYKYERDFYSDDGVAISYYWETPWLYLGKLSTHKKPKFLNTVIGRNSLGALQVNLYQDFKAPVTLSKTITANPESYWRTAHWRTAKWRSTKNVDYNIPLMGRGKAVKFSFAHSENYKPFSIILNEMVSMEGGFR